MNCIYDTTTEIFIGRYKLMNLSLQIDRFGFIGSIACVFHCIGCAFAPGVFAFLGLELFLESQAEWLFTIITCLIASFAFFFGYSNHKNKKILLIFLIGISALLSSRAIEESSTHHDTLNTSHHLEEHSATDKLESSGNYSAHHEIEKHESGFSYYLEKFGIIFGIFGGFLIAFAHLLNIIALACCEQKCIAKLS